ncbi:MAG: DNA modification methylase [Dehalococcoidia bacterium]|nr:DNA modification methylase [Dehalococcoidia bacterium]
MRDRTMELRRVRAGDLLSDPRNWREHPPAQIQALGEMIARIGFTAPLIVRETDKGLMIIDGHLRADINSDEIVPVVVVDLDEREAGEALATHDPLTMMAKAKEEELLALLAEVKEDLPIDYAEVLGIEEEATEPKAEGQVDMAKPEKPRTKEGDIWVLGNHRLMCGDARTANDIAGLLDGEKPALCVTDPPYGVNYDPDWRNRDIPGQFARARIGQPAGDDSPLNWGGVLDIYKPEVLYVWSPPGDHTLIFGETIKAAGYQIRAQIIWRKQQLVISRGHYHWIHEPCWYAVRKDATARWVGDRKQTTVWEIDNLNPMASADELKTTHSTQKPLECMERPIRNHEGDVYDPFLGSGTTLVAAERLGRRCFAMEIDPGWCDVAVRRWEQFTGREAELEPRQV